MKKRLFPHVRRLTLRVAKIINVPHHIPWQRFVLVAVAGLAVLVRCAHGRPLCLFRSRSVSNGVEPMIREFGLQRIVVERVLLPEILLTESDDVILFKTSVVVEGFVLGDEVFVCAGGDRPGDAAHVVLGAGVEHVWHVPHLDAVAHFETAGVFRRSRLFTFFHSEISPPRSCPTARSAKYAFCRRASAPRTKSSARNRACRDRACNP